MPDLMEIFLNQNVYSVHQVLHLNMEHVPENVVQIKCIQIEYVSV